MIRRRSRWSGGARHAFVLGHRPRQVEDLPRTDPARRGVAARPGSQRTLPRRPPARPRRCRRAEAAPRTAPAAAAGPVCGARGRHRGGAEQREPPPRRPAAAKSRSARRSAAAESQLALAPATGPELVPRRVMRADVARRRAGRTGPIRFPGRSTGSAARRPRADVRSPSHHRRRARRRRRHGSSRRGCGLSRGRERGDRSAARARLRLGLVARRRTARRRRRQEPQRVEVAVRVGRDPDAEVDVRTVHLRRTARPDGADECPFRDRRLPWRPRSSRGASA